MRAINEITQDINSELAFHGLGGYEIQITKVLDLMAELAEQIENIYKLIELPPH